MLETDAEVTGYTLGLVRADWLVSKSWNRLHFAELTPGQALELGGEGWLGGPVRLACGRVAAGVSVPGVFTRMGGQRCTGCCRALGLPPGKGSPKNDQACRALLGLA